MYVFFSEAVCFSLLLLPVPPAPASVVVLLPIVPLVPSISNGPNVCHPSLLTLAVELSLV